MAAPQPVIVQPGAPQQFVQPPPGAAPPGAPGNSCLLGYHFVHQTRAGTRAGGLGQCSHWVGAVVHRLPVNVFKCHKIHMLLENGPTALRTRVPETLNVAPLF